MRLVGLLVLLVSCSSYHHPAYDLTPGDTFQKVTEHMYGSEECVEISINKYCKWPSRKDIFVFKDNKFDSTLAEMKEPLQYQLYLHSVVATKGETKKIALVPGSRRLHEKSIQWKKYSPVFNKLITATGYELSQKPEYAVKLTFGIEDMQNIIAKRSIEYTAEKRGEEIWQITVSSQGPSRDFDRILPVLMTASHDFVKEPSNTTRTILLSENDLSVIGMKHYLGL
jgi:hypothetical protein